MKGVKGMKDSKHRAGREDRHRRPLIRILRKLNTLTQHEIEESITN